MKARRIPLSFTWPRPRPRPVGAEQRHAIWITASKSGPTLNKNPSRQSSTRDGVTEIQASRLPRVPSPIPFVPDVATFLRVIGRGLNQFESKFPSWEALFTLNSTQLREIGIEPPRTRRYLLRWLDSFRRGDFGPGGDFRHVENGTAVLAVEKDLAKDIKYVVNIPRYPPGTPTTEIPTEEKARVSNYRVKGGGTICGPYARISGPNVEVTACDGMWEHRRGQKVDGGERRRDEVRFKRKIAERRAQREANAGR